MYWPWLPRTTRTDLSSCVSGLKVSRKDNIAHWPFKIRAVQGHSSGALKYAADKFFQAKTMFAPPDLPHETLALFDEKPKARMLDVPETVYHRTYAGRWKSIVDQGILVGGVRAVNSSRAHCYFSEQRVGEEGYQYGLRSLAPIQISVALREAVAAGVVFFKTAAEGVLCVKRMCLTSLWSPCPTLSRTPCFTQDRPT